MNAHVANMDGMHPFYHAPVVVFVSHRKQDLQPGIERANAAFLFVYGGKNFSCLAIEGLVA